MNPYDFPKLSRRSCASYRLGAAGVASWASDTVALRLREKFGAVNTDHKPADLAFLIAFALGVSAQSAHLGILIENAHAVHLVSFVGFRAG